LEAVAFAPGAWVECPACRSQLSARFFPALTAPPEAASTASGELALEGESVCFFHHEKRATASCQRCGRFLCALCDVPFGGKHLCPSCLDSSKLPELVNRRLIWAKLSMLVGLLPLVFGITCPLWFMGVVVGPAAVFIALWGWRKPPSLVHGHRHGMAILGILGGLIQLGIVFGIGWFIANSSRIFGHG
jgi:hypothetical protein